jgi:ribonuclease P protein component
MQTEHLEARASASLLRYGRIGVVVPKYKRNIVERNRVRRRLRELARIRVLPSLGNVDLLIRAKPSAYSSGFPELAGELDQIAGMVNSASL